MFGHSPFESIHFIPKAILFRKVSSLIATTSIGKVGELSALLHFPYGQNGPAFVP